MKKKFVIIDGNSLINRAHRAVKNPMVTTKGVYTQGVYGFINMLDKIKKEHKPSYLAIAFDMKGGTFRHEMYQEYKGTRAAADLELVMQFPIIKDILEAMNIKFVEKQGFEADDLIGSLAKIGEKEGVEPIVITGDKDALQLISDNTKVLITVKGVSQFTLYNEEVFTEEFGFPPKDFVDYKALLGDKSDNIPGVKGIGKVAGTNLITKYGSIEVIYENIDEISPAGMKAKLEDGKLDAFLSKKLATIITDVEMDVKIEDFEIKDFNYSKLVELYKELEFNSLLKKLKLPKDIKLDNIDTSGYEKVYIKNDEELKCLVEQIRKCDEIGVKIIDSEAKDNKKSESSLLGFQINKSIWGISQNNKGVKHIFEAIKENKISIFGHQLRNEILLAFENKVDDISIKDDTAILKYVIDANLSDYTLEGLALRDFSVNLVVNEKDKQLSFDSLDDAVILDEMEFLTKQFIIIDRLRKNGNDILSKENNLLKLYRDIELPLIEVMAYMQFIGFSLDIDKLTKIGKDIRTKIEDITGRIYEFAGEEFNIRSNQQLGNILFEKLGLPSAKKTKTGYSTSAEVMEKLIGEHPIISEVLSFRKLTKLESTYIEAMIPLAKKDGKIHSTFNQTVASTGRISSSNPNMQNIPIRDKEGKVIRSVFVASDDYILVGADYSQIELRVLAHLSEDEALIESFNRGEDIHKSTAARVMGIDTDKVTALDRSKAKAVNFGVIYGMGAFSLSEDLDISWTEAKKYIDGYFAKHKKVKEFLDTQIDKAKEEGYVTTILGRKRDIKEISANNIIVRQAGERLAMNSPIQGSAADIIKIAMRKVYDSLKGMKSRLILQVHDELIVEAHKDELDKVKKLLRESMESAIKLKVQLIVDLHWGDSWLDLK